MKKSRIQNFVKSPKKYKLRYRYFSVSVAQPYFLMQPNESGGGGAKTNDIISNCLLHTIQRSSPANKVYIEPTVLGQRLVPAASCCLFSVTRQSAVSGPPSNFHGGGGAGVFLE